MSAHPRRRGSGFGANAAMGPAGAMSSTRIPGPVHPARDIGLLVLAAAPVAGLSVWYGFLEFAARHPSLKLGGAMVLGALGAVVLLLAPPSGPSPAVDGHRHSPLAWFHPLSFGVAWASMSAALVHFAVIEQHLAEYWVYGWFFVLVASAQLVWAAALVVRPYRLVLVAGAAGNALVVAAWVVTRTYGSLLGPAATEPSPAGFGDIVSTALEVSIVVGSVVLAFRPRLLGSRRSSPRAEAANVLIAIGLVLLTTLSLYSSVGGSPFVSHVG